jgi:hypothetical protein
VKVKITINDPGAEGTLTREMTTEQFNFLLWIAINWNNENPAHAAPFFYVEAVDVTPEVG